LDFPFKVKKENPSPLPVAKSAAFLCEHLVVRTQAQSACRAPIVVFRVCSHSSPKHILVLCFSVLGFLWSSLFLIQLCLSVVPLFLLSSLLRFCNNVNTNLNAQSSFYSPSFIELNCANILPVYTPAESSLWIFGSGVCSSLIPLEAFILWPSQRGIIANRSSRWIQQ
jgi:hypothetical protein